MKLLWIISISSLMISVCYSQKSEFVIHDNGLIYDSLTMNKLSSIVDDLNEKFRQCPQTRKVYSMMQGGGLDVYLDSADLKKAIQMIHQGSTPDELQNEFPHAEMVPIGLNYAHFVTDSEDSTKKNLFIHNLSGYGGSEYRHYVPIKGDSLFPQAGWHYNLKDEETDDPYLEAIYFPQGIRSQELPLRYAQMIAYAECLIDTNQGLYKRNTSGWRSYWTTDKNESNPFIRFNQYYNEKVIGKKGEGFTTEQVIEQLKTLEATNKKFNLLLDEAIEYAIEKGGGGATLEFATYHLRSKDIALELKRGRRVIGMCSMDDSPRLHAVSIANIAAETAQWEVFLRAHLDVMNDNFQRASDGSYAWGARQTYIRELEELNINVLDLLFGICLRIDNPSQHHYFSSIPRIGRALSESSKRPEVEARLLEYIADDSLDLFNRILFAYVLQNYAHALQSETDQERAKDLFLQARESLPEKERSMVKVWK